MNGKYYSFDHLAVSSKQSRRRSVSHHQEEADGSGSSSAGENGLLGQPGIDFPILTSIPLTGFHCRGRVPGYYGDVATACQVSPTPSALIIGRPDLSNC